MVIYIPVSVWTDLTTGFCLWPLVGMLPHQNTAPAISLKWFIRLSNYSKFVAKYNLWLFCNVPYLVFHLKSLNKCPFMSSTGEIFSLKLQEGQKKIQKIHIFWILKQNFQIWAFELYRKLYWTHWNGLLNMYWTHMLNLPLPQLWGGRELPKSRNWGVGCGRSV